MNLSRRRVVLIVLLMAISLIGLISVQVYLLGLAMEQKDQAFRQNVYAALSAVAQRLEAGETTDWALGAAGKTPPSGQFQVFVSHEARSQSDSLRIETMLLERDAAPGSFEELPPGSPLSVKNGVLTYQVTAPQHVTIQAYDRVDGSNRVVVDTFRTPGSYQVDLQGQDLERGQFMWVFRSDSTAQVFQGGAGLAVQMLSPTITQSPKGDFVRRIVSNLVIAELEPIEARVDGDKLSALLDRSLAEAGIDLDHEFGVTSGLSDSLRIVRPADYSRDLPSSVFRTRLFPHDLLAARSELVVYFPEQTTYLWRQMASLLTLSILFTLIVILIFAYALRIILAQKRLAVRIVDFINNMTHEFKTPISTVSLAAEAMMRPDVIAEPDKVTRYGRMIMHENLRMRTQVEKILQMAVLEEGDYELKRSPVDMHALISKAVESISLQVENREGSIATELRADRATVAGDALHLVNVLNNLLDNAGKYSPERPEIKVATQNRDDKLVITVSDRGIGISEADRKHVFEKYYRVPTGNIHDVKGFGLGLSYVKLIVEIHGGEIALDSAPGSGTTVTITLPLAQVASGTDDAP